MQRQSCRISLTRKGIARLRRSRSATIALIGLLLALLGTLPLLGRPQQPASLSAATALVPSAAPAPATPTAIARATVAPTAGARVPAEAAGSLSDWPQYRHD